MKTEDTKIKGVKRYTNVLKMAWAFEIVAALTGLTIALTSIDVFRDGLTTEDFITVLPIGLALSLVAFAELSKIPLVAVFMDARNWLWKMFYGAAVLLMVVITFETMLNGLVTGAQQRIGEVVEFDEKIFSQKDKIADKQERILILEDNLIGGKAETALKETIEANTKQAAAFQCETVTESRRALTLFLTKKQTVHVNEECVKQKEVYTKRLKQAETDLNTVKQGGPATKEAIDTLNTEIEQHNLNIQIINDEKTPVARKNSIYIMAFTLKPVFDGVYNFFGADIEEKELRSVSQLTQEDVNRVISLFFGILALIVAMVGPILASAYFVLNQENGEVTRKIVYNAQGEVVADLQRRSIGVLASSDSPKPF